MPKEDSYNKPPAPTGSRKKNQTNQVTIHQSHNFPVGAWLHLHLNMTCCSLHIDTTPTLTHTCIYINRHINTHANTIDRHTHINLQAKIQKDTHTDRHTLRNKHQLLVFRGAVPALGRARDRQNIAWRAIKHETDRNCENSPWGLTKHHLNKPQPYFRCKKY